MYAVVLAWSPACQTEMPSSRLQTDVSLPVPAAALATPSPARFASVEPVEAHHLSARSLIPIAFNRQPDIKSSYHRFENQAARYDFFYTSRDSLTPRFRTTSTFTENRAKDATFRERDHIVELGVEKRFFDTTELNVAVALDYNELDDDVGYHPLASANLRYPLWASREKLERTSEEIFWRNQVDDALLSYIQEVRSRLEATLFRFYECLQLRSEVENATDWRNDLHDLLVNLEAMAGDGKSADRRRVEAEIAKVTATARNLSGRFDVVMERLKAESGLPFNVRIELSDEPFNPFEGLGHEELFEMSVRTDPEIATLRNAARNAQVQLDLARRGRWDLALLLDGQSAIEGARRDEAVSEWAVSMGFEVSAVDPRVTESLIQQSQSNIARFEQAVASRENDIFVDTFEPLIRIQTLSESRRELRANLDRYRSDYDHGVDEYLADKLNIDDLLTRRENVFDQQEEIARLTFLVGANVAELCAATGKFFELLEDAGGR